MACAYCATPVQFATGLTLADFDFAFRPPIELSSIDALGFEPMTGEVATLFFPFVTYRYGRRSILITTNKAIRD